MKYTVVIRQPVPDEIRSSLEKELVERFGLNEQQAERLAARRAGRLLKPTTQARADLLMRVYQSVGAQVLMEEIPEESDAPSQAFRAASSVDDAVLAPPLANDSASDFSLASQPDAFSAAPTDGTFTPSDDPFAASFAPVTDPSPTEPLPDWAQRRDPNIPPDNNPEVNLLGGLPSSSGPSLSSTATSSEAAIARELQEAASAPAKPVADDWADFAGGLKLPEASAPAVTAPRTSTEFLTAVTDDAPAKTLPRTSVARQINIGTLIPVALSSLLTLGLLGVGLPMQQNRVSAASARNMATMIGTNLDVAMQSVNELQLNSVISNPDVGFVRVELPDGKSYVRSKNPQENEALNRQLSEWTKANPQTGHFKVDGASYTASRVGMFSTGSDQVVSVPGDQTAQGTLLRRVTVGISDQNAKNALLNTLLMTLFATLIGLGLAAMLARQSARRVVQPISELVKVADAISLGDLTRPVKAASNDEIGDLAQALERMRLSLEAAMDRLRRRKR